MKLLDIVHPAAKTLVDIAKSQDAEVSVIVLARLLQQSNHWSCVSWWQSSGLSVRWPGFTSFYGVTLDFYGAGS